MRRCARATRRDLCEKARPSRLTGGSNQWGRADTGLTGRNIAHRRKLRSRTLRRAIAGFDLIRFVTQAFPALLVNTRHLQVAEGVAFLHRNPTGHLNFAARSAEPCALHIAPAPTASFSKLVGQFARVGKSTRRMSRTFPRERFNLLRVADGFSAPVDRFSCAGQTLFLRGIGYPAHGICGRQTEQRKNKGWQDRLPPVFWHHVVDGSIRPCENSIFATEGEITGHLDRVEFGKSNLRQSDLASAAKPLGALASSYPHRLHRLRNTKYVHDLLEV